MSNAPDPGQDAASDPRAADTRRYLREWRIWAGVAVAVALVCVYFSLRAGRVIIYYPALGIVVIWAIVLLVIPIFPAGRDKS